MARHRMASPECPFVRDMSDNIPLLSTMASLVDNNTASTTAASSDNEDAATNDETPNRQESHDITGKLFSEFGKES